MALLGIYILLYTLYVRAEKKFQNYLTKGTHVPRTER